MSSANFEYLLPDWPSPTNIKSLVTKRIGGNSLPPFDGFNLAMHVGDNPKFVQDNRVLLESVIPSKPFWLNQTHSADVWISSSRDLQNCIQTDADASITIFPQQVLAILTADCLPVLLTDHSGQIIAAAHAGWRGLSNGILENTVQEMIKTLSARDLNCSPSNLMAWIGPAIGPEFFEVGQDVYDCFLKNFGHKGDVTSCFKPSTSQGKYLADLYQLAHMSLSFVGVKSIYGKVHCSFKNTNDFFSYRRDGKTGRFASLIWIDK